MGGGEVGGGNIMYDCLDNLAIQQFSHQPINFC